MATPEKNKKYPGISDLALDKSERVLTQEGVTGDAQNNWRPLPTGGAYPVPGTSAYPYPGYDLLQTAKGVGKVAAGTALAPVGAANRLVRAGGVMLRGAMGQKKSDIAAQAAQPDVLDYSSGLVKSGIADLGNEVSRGRIMTGFELEPGASPQIPTAISHGPSVPRETASPAGKPGAASIVPARQETQITDAGIRGFSVGPERPLPDRFVPQQFDTQGRVIGGQINPWNDSIGADIERAKQADTFEPVPGGNVSQMKTGVSAEELAKRRTAGIDALDSYNETLDRANILEGAHGSRAGRRAIMSIAAIDAAKTKAAGTHANAALEAEKAKADIFQKTASAYKDLGLVNKDVPFDAQKAEEKALSITKDPVKASVIAGGWQRKSQGSAADVYHKLNVYDSGFNKVPMVLYGHPNNDGQTKNAISRLLSDIEITHKEYDGNFWKSDADKSLYSQKMNSIQEALMKLGVVMLPDVG